MFSHARVAVIGVGSDIKTTCIIIPGDDSDDT